MGDDVSGLAAGLQLGPGGGSRSRSSLAGRKSSGVYRPPRPSSLPSAEDSVSGRPSLSYSVSRTSVGGTGAPAAAKSKNYQSRFQKVGDTPAGGDAPAPAPQARAQLDGHPCVPPPHHSPAACAMILWVAGPLPAHPSVRARRSEQPHSSARPQGDTGDIP
jgi:hypothetical protein